jgi:hypothetical protein
LDENKQVNEGTGDETMECPLCSISGVRVTGSRSGHPTEYHDNAYLQTEGHSSKIQALVTNIKDGLWESKRFVPFDAL